MFRKIEETAWTITPRLHERKIEKKKSSLHDTGSLALAHWTLTPPSYSETSRREAQTEPYQHDILPDQAGQIKLSPKQR